MGFALFALVGAAYAAPFVYVANDNDDNVSVMDTATNTVVAAMTVGTSPQDIAINSAGTRGYVTTGNSVLVIVGAFCIVPAEALAVLGTLAPASRTANRYSARF